MINKTVSVIGGDSRQIYAAEHLSSLGYKVGIYACEHGKIGGQIYISENLKNAFESDFIILPLPVSKNSKTLNSPLSSLNIEIKDIAELTTEKNTVFLGMGNKSLVKLLEARAKLVCDYYLIEKLIYKNAFLTAESVLGIILEKIKVSVSGMRAAVTGYGRISTFLCSMLKDLGADVTVFARDSLQRTKAELRGHKVFDINELHDKASIYDCIVNTVPYPVIGNDTIKKISAECVLIECASAPYGFVFDACDRLNKNVIKAFSLPGKKRPKTAGIIIAQTIDEIIKGGCTYEKN